MISYSAYRVIHLVGIFLLLVVLGGAARAGRAAAGDTTREAVRARRLAAGLHGLALFIVLLGGFGLLARLGIVHGTEWPGWVWAKVVIWLVAGGLIVVPRRKPGWGAALLFVLPLLGGLAAWLAIFKPV
jgi:hypothetical protein